MAEGEKSLRAELDGRLEDAAMGIKADTQGQIDARIERLVGEQAGDLFAALKPFVAEGEKSLRADIQDRIEQALATLNPIVQDVIRAKNNAQDDAIIGIGAKVDAHEIAIQELATYLRQIFTHPLFR